MSAHLVGTLNMDSILKTLECIDHGGVSEEVCREGDEVDSMEMDGSLEKQDALPRCNVLSGSDKRRKEKCKARRSKKRQQEWVSKNM